ncbi:MAG TPA: hypothetical protein VJ841_03185 [Candidatus Saccharimonadales bacterium]|nr:hypothetical protein [Candidatus Saccharimonadales bacterium]
MRGTNVRGLLVAFRGTYKKALRFMTAGTVAGLVLAGSGYATQQALAALPPVAYSGSSNATLLDIHTLQIATFNVAGLKVEPAATSANTASSPRTVADAHNLGGSVIGLDISPLLLGAHSVAPPGTADNNSLASLGANPLLAMNAMTVNSEANWTSDTACVANTLSRSATSATNLSVANLGVISLINAQLLATDSKTALLPTGGANDERKLVSTASASVNSLTIAGVPITVGGTPTITAQASGLPGGASATYTAPTVTVAGQPLSLGQSITVNTVGLGLAGLTPQITVTLNNPTITQAADGSHASGSVSVLSVRVFQPVPLLPDIEILGLDLMPLQADATMDGTVGGLQCYTPPTELNANDDSFSTVQGAGGVVGNALTNDTQNNAPATTSTVTLSYQDPSSTGITIAPNGDITVPSTLAPGTYTVPYQICEVAVPGHCDPATVTVTVTSVPPVTLVANNDNFIADEGDTNLGSIIINDSANGQPIDPTKYTATITNNGGITGASVDANGNLVIPATTPGGMTYALHYNLCQNSLPTNCANADITLILRGTGNSQITTVSANDDVYQMNVGGGTAGNVFENDTINGQPMSAGAVTLTSESLEPGITIQGSGDVTVAASTAAGTYSLGYVTCANADPTVCDAANVKVTLVSQSAPTTNTGGSTTDTTTGDPWNGGLASTGSDALLIGGIASIILTMSAVILTIRRRNLAERLL